MENYSKLTRMKTCILRVIDALEKAIALCDCYASLMLSNLLHASITRQMHTNHEPRVNNWLSFNSWPEKAFAVNNPLFAFVSYF